MRAFKVRGDRWRRHAKADAENERFLVDQNLGEQFANISKGHSHHRRGLRHQHRDAQSQ